MFNLETTMPLHPSSKTLRPPSRPISRRPSLNTAPTTMSTTTATTTTTTRKTHPSTLSRQQSSTLQRNQQSSDLLITTISPLVHTIHHFQQLAYHLYLNTLFALTILASASFVASKAVAYRSFLLSKILAESGVLAGRWVYAKVWNGQRSRLFRKRLEFEIFVLLFGSGNTILLLVLWPGWIVLGLAGVGWWLVNG
ncbi:hypothetical protein QC763_302390 [Podospora pseudopauciseta]|uniref:Uncharacterized protein n=2 Tax=Podospora TaxID=5144 RepID=A0ABR0HFQ1_9PEZI|nr:hypothetical protein QC763_302390 [Podospora pseudopauciseta]KAK4677836.1 hypothetical protein QC764_302390 [Podospora pseudoanserina]